MSDEDIPRRGLFGKLLAALTPVAATAAPPPEPPPKAAPPKEPPKKDDSGGLGKGKLREIPDPLAGWRR